MKHSWRKQHDGIVAVLLDVDGVLSPFASSAADRAHWPADSWRSFILDGIYEIEWSAALVDRLREISETPGVATRWCTTWGRRAPAVLGPAIGLGAKWPVLDDAGGAFAVSPGWWKAQRAREALEEFTAVVWVDDFIDGWREARAELDEPGPRWWDTDRLLMISPASDRGLEPAHLDAVERFVRDRLDNREDP
ncbi:HAD domain-containing protein [Demequina sp. SYSU T00192]|uniref:HAD domain-containing protein n=1 Tax=Demequina litoralis TaxID=3051660 RepID=A0ABT8GAS0_9MICO|nr:HAD domain-containing protein [Demequina sp. SYSU T00192]MDN4476234.1 HAD domain-containing protein [Demequina sp. SYSU T00192]